MSATLPLPDDLPDDIAEVVAEITEASGFTPNVLAAMARDPAMFRAFFTMHDLLMDKETPGLSRADRELVAVATSAANDCTYCVVAHGAILRIRDKDPEVADMVAIDHRKAPLSPRRRALVDYAVRLARTPERVGPADTAALAEHAFTEPDVADIVGIVGFFAFSNRWAHAFDLRPNPEFFSMGR